MRRNPRGFDIAAPLVICLGCLLALVISVREYRRAPGRLALAAVTQPDLDGDGRPDTIMMMDANLQVRSGAGGLLLAYAGKVAEWQLASLGGEYPVLFAQTAPDEWAAFVYSPGRGIMQMLPWPDGRMRGYGHLTPAGALVESGGGRPREVKLGLDRLRLTRSR